MSQTDATTVNKNREQLISYLGKLEHEGDMPDLVREACEVCFDAHANDCSGFARAVASRLAVTLSGLANDIVETIQNDPAWSPLADGVAAAQAAAASKLVLGGL